MRDSKLMRNNVIRPIFIWVVSLGVVLACTGTASAFQHHYGFTVLHKASQPSAAFKQVLRPLLSSPRKHDCFSSRAPTTRKKTLLRLADASYPLLLFRDYPRVISSSTFYSSSSPSSFRSSIEFFDDFDDTDLPQQNGDDYDTDEMKTMEDHIDLSYLPSRGENLPPKTRELLMRITSYYVRGRMLEKKPPPVQLDEVLNVLDEEFKYIPVPFSVGENVSFVPNNERRAVNNNNKVTNAMAGVDAGNILSFAAMYRIPRDLTLLLFGDDDVVMSASSSSSESDERNQKSKKNEEKKRRIRDIHTYKMAFKWGGWKSVSFPHGLGIRIRRRYAPSTLSRFSPLPRRFLPSSKRKAADEATVAVKEAANTKAPLRRMSRKEFLASMEKELQSTSIDLPTTTGKGDSADDEILWTLSDNVPFFPRRNGFFQRLSRAIKSQTNKLKSAGRAGLISYGVLNFLWYTLAIIWQWRTVVKASVSNVSSQVPETNFAALGTSIRKFGRVLVTVYIGSQVTKLPRLTLAVLLAPLGDRALRFAETKLRVGENAAFWIVTGFLVGSCLAIWATVILGDAALSSVGTFRM